MENEKIFTDETMDEEIGVQKLNRTLTNGELMDRFIGAYLNQLELSDELKSRGVSSKIIDEVIETGFEFHSLKNKMAKYITEV